MTDSQNALGTTKEAEVLRAEIEALEEQLEDANDQIRRMQAHNQRMNSMAHANQAQIKSLKEEQTALLQSAASVTRCDQNAEVLELRRELEAAIQAIAESKRQCCELQAQLHRSVAIRHESPPPCPGTTEPVDKFQVPNSVHVQSSTAESGITDGISDGRTHDTCSQQLDLHATQPRRNSIDACLVGIEEQRKLLQREIAEVQVLGCQVRNKWAQLGAIEGDLIDLILLLVQGCSFGCVGFLALLAILSP